MASLTVERELPAPPERVWRAFTDPEALTGWFWPPRMQPSARIAAEAGGEVRIRSEIADIGITGHVTEAAEPSLLAFTWRWDGEPAETNVTLRFAADGDGTRLTVQHEGFADEDAVREHVEGWDDCLDRLVASLG